MPTLLTSQSKPAHQLIWRPAPTRPLFVDLHYGAKSERACIRVLRCSREAPRVFIRHFREPGGQTRTTNTTKGLRLSSSSESHTIELISVPKGQDQNFNKRLSTTHLSLGLQVSKQLVYSIAKLARASARPRKS
jgi:hypothetical protein